MQPVVVYEGVICVHEDLRLLFGEPLTEYELEVAFIERMAQEKIELHTRLNQEWDEQWPPDEDSLYPICNEGQDKVDWQKEGF